MRAFGIGVVEKSINSITSIENIKEVMEICIEE